MQKNGKKVNYRALSIKMEVGIAPCWAQKECNSGFCVCTFRKLLSLKIKSKRLFLKNFTNFSKIDESLGKNSEKCE